jgi:hypothetical protein
MSRPRPDLTDEADYQRCRKLNAAMDIPGGVLVTALHPPKRATLINALVSIPGFPPGVRVVLLGEREMVRGSVTRNNPGGTPISRDYHSSDVELWQGER